MLSNEEYFIKLLVSLEFVKDFENETVIRYTKEDKNSTYYMSFDKDNSIIHVKVIPIITTNTKLVYLTEYDAGIRDIKYIFRKEIRLLKISKLLDECE